MPEDDGAKNEVVNICGKKSNRGNFIHPQNSNPGLRLKPKNDTFYFKNTKKNLRNFLIQ